MGYTNSPLVCVTKLTPKCNTRDHQIDTITIHCLVGQWSAERITDYFFTTDRDASCNYGIGTDGRICLCVEEKNRSWCSSSEENDQRAITIECASDTTYPYAINGYVYDSLINLCEDICRRNGIKELKWKADKSLIGQVDKQNMTVHRWFATKACPGDYIYNRLGEIAEEVNKRLRGDDFMDGEQIYNELSNYLKPQEPSKYAIPSVKKAVESGLFVDGNGDGLLDNPKAFMTREQLAVVLDRAGLLDK